ncbi:DUF2306 domain-containing protein [Sphingomonas sp. SORGH_AS_0879]|uniref:DUF2306 domain-containing protein n=1 Tax=Sphingomonas sp. SORGH_AS_0879 TaxID=3041790 RepID=UPI00278625AE|nr:DUF2306 domain-containing protein [Sphingomonas sp. SORGH_AS_0879]MDQ1228648.1 putative membrane protein [Sphingomonas sp. SORGH_AS_0879]
MMASVAHPAAPRASVRPERIDRLLSAGAVILFVAAVAAILRGHDQWRMVPALIWLHLATILVATALTPVMLLRVRGDRRHRTIGKLWIVAMLATAISSLFIHVSGPGRFSVIHLLSFWTLVQVPLIWWTARRHDVARHRRAVHGMVIGALLVAGFFTFPFHRLLGTWLFG